MTGILQGESGNCAAKVTLSKVAGKKAIEDVPDGKLSAGRTLSTGPAK